MRQAVKVFIAIFLLIPAFFTASIALAADIPYKEQDHEHKNKGMCGAGSLDMVYASFGKPQDQHKIFEAIAVPSIKDGEKSSSGSPYKMSRDAINRGFYALTLGIKDPQIFLKNFQTMSESVRVVLVHKVYPKSKGCHATVLLDTTDKYVIVHDPSGKPNRHIKKDFFLEMWKERGYCLAAISDEKYASNNCAVCGRDIPDKVSCPTCPKMIGLDPKEALGCIDNSCPNRMWNYILCPYCGHPIDDISGAEGLSSKMKKSKTKKENNAKISALKPKS